MTFDQFKNLYADWARPTAIYGVTAAFIIAVCRGAKADELFAIGAALGALYVGKAAENVGVAKATATGATS